MRGAGAAASDDGAALAEARRRVVAAERARVADLQARQDARLAAGQTRGGKASGYTREIGEAVCARLEAGETLTAIGRDPAMPSYGVILRWVKRFPEFQEMYVAARAVQCDYLFDEARDVALWATRADVPVARLQFDVIRWQTARLAPKKYLERLVASEAAAAAGDGEDADDLGGPLELVFSVTRFENVGGRVLAAPPRNAGEAEAWVEATGRAYEAGVGPSGELRPPMSSPQEWARGEALRARLEREQAGRRRR